MRAGETGEVIPQDVILRDAGPNRAAVAEVVRAMTGLEASAAADLVARTPSAIRVRIAPALAEALRAKLVAAGAVVEVRAHAPAPAAPLLFDVYLQDRGANKINVVRALKQMMGLGLREAVELVDDAPSLLKRRVDQDEAEALRHELVEAGATVEVRPHDGSAPPERTATSEAPVTWGVATTPANLELEGFGVVLRHFGVHKINVIKLIREATGLGLKEAKDLSESTDALIKQGMSEDEAHALARALTAVGASVEVRGQARAMVTATATSGSGGEFGVKLKQCGPNKISVIKAIREVTGLGLKDAKDLSESTDVWIKQDMSADEARALERTLVSLGASVEVHGESWEATPERDTTALDVVLVGCGPNKISVIKLIRERLGCGLKDAKDLSETPGAVLREGIDPEDAEELKRQLVALGAIVELREREAPRPAPQAESQRVDVFLRSCGPNKILVIKTLREFAPFGLKEAKDMVEAAPRVLLEKVDMATARRAESLFAQAGADVELR
jgi:ribosomal protein L7/L12